jgi:hypothetical protein
MPLIRRVAAVDGEGDAVDKGGFVDISSALIADYLHNELDEQKRQALYFCASVGYT